jgi:hypothetical protein
MNNRRRIADEAVGQRPASAIPEAAKDRVPEGRPANSAGPHASVAAMTAEAMGETSGDAYAYPDATPEEARARSRASLRHGSARLDSTPPMLTAAAAFALGYVAALVIHRR